MCWVFATQVHERERLRDVQLFFFLLLLLIEREHRASRPVLEDCYVNPPLLPKHTHTHSLDEHELLVLICFT